MSFAAVAISAALPSQTWLSSTPGVAPAARRFHAMAFDASRGHTVLFGGRSSTGAVLGDTWSFDGANWTMLPGAAPAGRLYHGMVYDRARQRIVLFGGGDVVSTSGETWEHDGTSWTQVTTAHSPPPRLLPGLAYDAGRRKTVLFGGRTDPGTPMADTWEYDGVDWTQVVTPSAPQARSGHSLVHDTARARTVLFGGHDNLAGLGNYLGDTWQYDGNTWSPVPASGPAPRGLHAAVFDAPTGRMLVYGGRGQPLSGGHGGGGSIPVYSDTWAFDGVSWTQIAAGTPPSARYAHAMSTAGTSTDAVLFGGGLGATGVESGDTWRLLPSTAPTWARHGTGCAGAGSVPQLGRAASTLPVLGSTFTLELSALPATPGLTVLAFATEFAQWNGVPLPMPLDALRPQCQLWIDPFTNWVLLHAGTTASAAIVIPANPSLAGFVLGAQALAFESSAAGFALSNAGLMRVN